MLLWAFGGRRPSMQLHKMGPTAKTANGTEAKKPQWAQVSHHFPSADSTAPRLACSKPSIKMSSSLKPSCGFPQHEKSSTVFPPAHVSLMVCPCWPSSSHYTLSSNTWPQAHWSSHLLFPLQGMLFSRQAPSHSQLKCHLLGEVSPPPPGP